MIVPEPMYKICTNLLYAFLKHTHEILSWREEQTKLRKLKKFHSINLGLRSEK